MSDKSVRHDKEYTKYYDQAKRDKILVCRPPKHPSQELKVVLPLAPSINEIYSVQKVGKRGHAVTTNSIAKNYIKSAQNTVKKQVIKQKYKVEPQGVWLVMEVVYYVPDRGVRDVHNMHKVLADALEGVAYHNDRWVIIKDMDVIYDPNRPRMEVTVKCQEKTEYQVLKKN